MRENDNPESSLLHPIPITIPEDKYHFAYSIYFMIGLGYLLPWNAFITAVDYFSYLYPDVSVDRIFALVYMLLSLIGIFLIILYTHKSDPFLRINLGFALFLLSLLIVPLLDAFHLHSHLAFYVTAASVALAGVADALVQASIVGSAGQLPERYMQAVIAGTAASGVLVSVLRIFTKLVYSQDPSGLRKSANLYFSVSIVIVFISMLLYNIVHTLPVIKYYNQLNIQALPQDQPHIGPFTGPVWRSSVWNTVGRIKWCGFGIVLIYVVTLAIFPGYITEDVHSQLLKDWYPILLIAGYNLGDLLGKCLTAVYLLQNAKIAIASCIARLLFFPLFLGCLHGPKFFRTEIPVTILTCLLGITNGYLTSALMIMAPKIVKLQHAETAGIVSVLFLVFGLAAGSIIAWFWVI
ncbi:unnamed protein product [Lupinus luteus]|uniref:Equilibrative nucleotide transporter 1 n=1 Tax=Lupinus luteus TaxID=3873 RepID=A0AAV1W4Y1_LUPLU